MPDADTGQPLPCGDGEVRHPCQLLPRQEAHLCLDPIKNRVDHLGEILAIPVQHLMPTEIFGRIRHLEMRLQSLSSGGSLSTMKRSTSDSSLAVPRAKEPKRPM